MEFEKLKDIIVEVLDIDPERIEPESSFIEDLGADSLDVAQILIGVEDEFDIDIPDEEMEKVVTVKDAVDVIKAAK
ncbi:MAG: acyl carrier protein [Eubacteriales bacterium]|nr:acyl carrier protein [Eubacteriales bacterium]